MEEQKKSDLVLDVNENPKGVGKWFILALQHVLAMLVACITVPIIVNASTGYSLPIGATLISAGLGTLFYIFMTKKKSPVFLSSSFAYLSPMMSALTVGLIGGAAGGNYLALILGMAFVGITYCAIALIVKFTGTGWINKLLPAIVVGPMIMVIGLSLSGSAINNISVANGSTSAHSYNLVGILCGLITMIITAVCAHYGKKTISLIPFVLGMAGGYIVACLFSAIGYGANVDYLKIVDFTPFQNIFSSSNISFASFFNYKLFIPNDPQSFIFLRTDEMSQFDWATIGEVALLFIPVSLVTVCEHIGDHLNLSNIIHHDIFKEVGMHRTLIGDGVATAVSGALCGAANTTYGENVGVIGLTKVASVNVVLLAALFSIVFGFFTPFTALLETIPSCVCGGVSLLLYGFIASSGVKMLINNKIDFSKTKNILVASVILVSGIGGFALNFTDSAGKTVIQITSIAVAMLLGIFLNAILREKKTDKVDPTAKDSTITQVDSSKTE